ncbi:MAG: hypothetical protein HFJ08_08310 [Lachnospiraceae bacterium]|jgi:predicted ATPase|nr:hypothetical protein [Lachnospiraceae bacterium]
MFFELKDSFSVVQLKVLSDIGTYHFHDTSVSSPIKACCDKNDNMEFASERRNIAAALYMIRLKYQKIYHYIVKVIRLAASYFKGFYIKIKPSCEE